MSQRWIVQAAIASVKPNHGYMAMQVVAIGFVVSVVQDSAETALNSSTDVLFTAAACPREVALPAEELA